MGMQMKSIVYGGDLQTSCRDPPPWPYRKLHPADQAIVSSGSFLPVEFRCVPRTFMMANANCNPIKAHAPVCQPQITQSTLLARNHQKPCSRRRRIAEATNQAATMLTTMAGH